MFTVCPACGEYRPDKTILPEGPWAECPVCGHRHKFRMLPLFVVTGASGTGKTAVCLRLPELMDEVVVLESDILLGWGATNTEQGVLDYRNHCLNICKNIAQSGRPVVLCGSALPEQYERGVERRYFSAMHTLALVCSPQRQRERLLARPAWRGAGGAEFLTAQSRFNQWFWDNADGPQPFDLLDTTDMDDDTAATRVAQWVWGLL